MEDVSNTRRNRIATITTGLVTALVHSVFTKPGGSAVTYAPSVRNLACASRCQQND
jgi:hypothetical protein